ncbi:MAG: hypothetical protein IAC55_08350 [Tyzzerella sp.]|uniref:Uncharacterized protein n=1 Tax=Candidatus Fimicola merdigallinarum TaxID=2840819 RepID=A0A9D9DYU3_9FIRM|nr:hypothetical protein [Candidatus Fimicola merdigallinarum]
MQIEKFEKIPEQFKENTSTYIKDIEETVIKNELLILNNENVCKKNNSFILIILILILFNTNKF